MNSFTKRSGLESVSIGYLLIAFAVSFLLAWQFGDWLLLIPFFLIAAGAYYLVMGVLYRPGEEVKRRGMRDSFFFVFWGGTLALVGIMWLINRQSPGNVPLLLVIFILWIGAIVLLMSLPRLRGSVKL
jgi:4-hydroxybenzoate polyprenyltransferase